MSIDSSDMLEPHFFAPQSANFLNFSSKIEFCSHDFYLLQVSNASFYNLIFLFHQISQIIYSNLKALVNFKNVLVKKWNFTNDF